MENGCRFGAQLSAKPQKGLLWGIMMNLILWSARTEKMKRGERYNDPYGYTHRHPGVVCFSACDSLEPLPIHLPRNT